MPRLTVRSLAEMLNLPAYDQERILAEQKYPRQGDQRFRTPFYQPAVTAIRNFYEEGRNARALAEARREIGQIGLSARRDNNLRVISGFEQSAQVSRDLLPRPNPRIEMTLRSTAIRLSVDLRATENDEERFIYYNCRNTPIDAELARVTLEIGYWLLDENGIDATPSGLELVDLRNGRVYRGRSPRSRTMSRVRSNIRIIEALWPNI
jgi:hypothetical protein